jgi:hypothetical protein
MAKVKMEYRALPPPEPQNAADQALEQHNRRTSDKNAFADQFHNRKQKRAVVWVLNPFGFGDGQTA